MAEQEAEVKPGDIKPDDLEKLEPEPTGQEQEQEGEAEKPTPGIEITREAKGSLPKGNNFGVSKRINKLNARNAETAKERDQATGDLEMEREKNRILSTRIDQMSSDGKGYSKPNPDNYDGGTYDPKFEEDSAQFKIKEEVSKQVAEQTKGFRETSANEKSDAVLRQSQETYYKQADSLEVTDFNDTEQKALDLLGLDAANAIIGNFTKDSHLLMYFFGKNEEEAKSFRNLWDTDKIQAVAEIGGIRSELKIVPKSTTNAQPDPDEEVEGGSASKVEMLQRKYDKLLEKKMANPGDSTIYPKMIQLRKEMQRAAA